MTKFTAQGTEVYLQKIASPAPVGYAVTGVTNAKPAVVTIASTDITNFTDGQLVTMSGTGSALDGKTFPIAAVGTPANSFTLVGSDLSGNATPVTAGKATPIAPADLLRFCLASWEWEVEAADAIDVTTFCGSESLAGTPQPGNISIEGFTDFDVAAQTEWRNAVFDGQRRVMEIVLPGDRGEIVLPVTISGYTMTMETNEAVSFSGEAVVNEVPLFITD
ncbi:hypothetical protein [Sinorhizobium meliloti]|uniref:hypothetical protein n=1 Tax=Rhizobium meliloti TaxID=382 RepID=UPI000FD46563|nr:hypothetical protein [Sinorhizobium meliloti]MDW9823506.1 hypothetical protein [Sinorhizobium meliloti]MDW9866373.1 hypothetical protein [Sinorhizobium meliloti]RVG63177.1 hypothetical protein CN224_06125 [Sinorhizobium meliloti]